MQMRLTQVVQANVGIRVQQADSVALQRYIYWIQACNCGELCCLQPSHRWSSKVRPLPLWVVTVQLQALLPAGQQPIQRSPEFQHNFIWLLVYGLGLRVTPCFRQSLQYQSSMCGVVIHNIFDIFLISIWKSIKLFLNDEMSDPTILIIVELILLSSVWPRSMSYYMSISFSVINLVILLKINFTDKVLTFKFASHCCYIVIKPSFISLLTFKPHLQSRLILANIYNSSLLSVAFYSHSMPSISNYFSLIKTPSCLKYLSNN